MSSTEKSSILSTQIQMNEAKNTAGKAKLNSKCAMHRLASKRDFCAKQRERKANRNNQKVHVKKQQSNKSLWTNKEKHTCPNRETNEIRAA